MTDFTKMLNWKLLSGSHDFPGPDGGTCINEAAIVAAGFDYISVGSVDDLPKCFSRPISQLALRLNDSLPKDERQQLMKYVTKLAGTTDNWMIEAQRRSAKNDLIYMSLQMLFFDRATDFFTLESMGYKFMALRDSDIDPEDVLIDTIYKVSSETHLYYPLSVTPAMLTSPLSWSQYSLSQALLDIGMQALDAMLAIGKKAPDVDISLVQQRMETIKNFSQKKKEALGADTLI